MRTAATYVKDGADPHVVVEASGGIVLMGQAYADAYQGAHRERALPSEVQRATWAAFEMLAHGRQWRLVRRALARAAERRISLAYAYSDVAREGSIEGALQIARQMDASRAAGEDLGYAFAHLAEASMSPELRGALEIARQIDAHCGSAV
ncbi:MAG: hypothetical protein ACOH17_04365 [Cellulomonas sp.]